MPNNATQILQITDLHLLATQGKTLLNIDTEASLEGVLEVISHHSPPDLILLTGDLVQDPVISSYQRLIRICSKLNVPCYCLPGNHDDAGLMHKMLNTANLSTADRIVTADHQWQIIMLNSQIPGSEAGHLDETELLKLHQYLETHTGLNALIAMHHHPCPVGSRWLDTMVIDNGHELLETVRSYEQVKGVLFGHIHQDYQKNYYGIQLLGTPSSCFQFKPDSADFALDPVPAGCRWLTLGADGSLRSRVDRAESIPQGFDLQQVGY